MLNIIACDIKNDVLVSVKEIFRHKHHDIQINILINKTDFIKHYGSRTTSIEASQEKINLLEA